MKDICTEWVELEGYLYRYRLGDNGDVQRFYSRKGWKSLTPFVVGVPREGNCRSGRLAVNLTVAPNKTRKLYIAPAVAQYFMGGIPEGYRVAHKNGSKLDCAKYNLVFMTQEQIGKKFGGTGRKPVAKVSKAGVVLEFYKSISEAAKKNYVSRRAVYMRCIGKIKDPCAGTGYTFRYEE